MRFPNVQGRLSWNSIIYEAGCFVFWKFPVMSHIRVPQSCPACLPGLLLTLQIPNAGAGSEFRGPEPGSNFMVIPCTSNIKRNYLTLPKNKA